VGLVPVAIALFWSLPFIDSRVLWQPIASEILQGREVSGGLHRPAPAEWERALRYFPLERDLHHFAAMRELEKGTPGSGGWQKHFEIVHRLVPAGWRYPIVHARAVQRISPTLCIGYWQVAIDRSDWRAPGMLGEALRETSNLPRADSLWADYVSANPQLALPYAKLLPGDEGRPFYGMWWEKRGQMGDLTGEEVKMFYEFATRWATPEQIDGWIRTHADRRTEDGRKWMGFLHVIGQDERAWALYAEIVAEPAYPRRADDATLKVAETRVRLAPDNPAHLVDLAHMHELSGDGASAREIILAAAEKKNAATWFLRKAAYLLAADGRFRDAVEMALREKWDEPRVGKVPE